MKYRRVLVGPVPTSRDSRIRVVLPISLNLTERIGNGLPLAAVCYYAGRLQEYCHNACISTRTGVTLCARLQAALCLRCWIKKRGRSTVLRLETISCTPPSSSSK